MHGRLRRVRVSERGPLGGRARPTSPSSRPQPSGVSATTALQLLRDDGHVQSGQKVIFARHVRRRGHVRRPGISAQAFGAEVSGVTSTKNLELVRSIGADHVIKGAEGLHGGVNRWASTSSSTTSRTTRCRRRGEPSPPTGRCCPTGGGHAGGALYGRVIRLAIVSMFVRQQGKPSLKVQTEPTFRSSRRALRPTGGAWRRVIEQRTCSLRKTPRAIGHVAAGHARGTVVAHGRCDATCDRHLRPDRGRNYATTTTISPLRRFRRTCSLDHLLEGESPVDDRMQPSASIRPRRKARSSLVPLDPRTTPASWSPSPPTWRERSAEPRIGDQQPPFSVSRLTIRADGVPRTTSKMTS